MRMMLQSKTTGETIVVDTETSSRTDWLAASERGEPLDEYACDTPNEHATDDPDWRWVR